MSHIKLIEPEREYSIEGLQVMAKLMGAIMVKSKTWGWYGKWVGDTPLPKELILSDLNEVDYEIRYPDAKYSIGVKVKNNRVHLLYDFWNGGYGLETALGGSNCGKLKQHYNMAEALLTAKKQRRRVWEIESPHKFGRRLIIDME